MKNNWIKKNHDKFLGLFEAGFTVKQVAFHFNKSVSTISNYRRILGIRRTIKGEENSIALDRKFVRDYNALVKMANLNDSFNCSLQLKKYLLTIKVFEPIENNNNLQ